MTLPIACVLSAAAVAALVVVAGWWSATECPRCHPETRRKTTLSGKEPS